jgi:microcystin-dependent protein
LFHPRSRRQVGVIASVAFSIFAAALLADSNTGTTGGFTPVDNHQPSVAIYYIIALQGIFPDDVSSTPSGSSPPNRSSPFLGEIKAVAFNFAPQGWALCQGQFLSKNQNQALDALIGNTFGGDANNIALPDLRERVPVGAGQGAGLPNYALGQVVGSATPLMSVANLPPHSHTANGGNTANTGSGTPLENRQPALALNFRIAADGEIIILPWSRNMSGWTPCDGRLLMTADHSYLFAQIGTRYGGNGTTDFALPDLRGRVPIGDDDGNSRPIALAFGSNDTILTAADIPSHLHSLPPSGVTGLTGGPGFSANNFQPSLGMRWLISLFGVYPTTTTTPSFPVIGEIRLIAGSTSFGLPEEGWPQLEGQLYRIEDYETLFDLIATTYGGDGQETFAVPDLRSRVMVHPSLNFINGAVFGSDVFAIATSQMAAHSHVLAPEITIEQPVGTNLLDASSTVDFGTVGSNGGNVVKTFTITNSGAENLQLTGITKDGANPVAYSIGAIGSTTLAPGVSTTFDVTFSPNLAGTRTAAIHVASNDADENTFDVSLTGKRLTHLEDWRLQYFNDTSNSGDGADANDFEHDGLSNALEFAIGGDPKHFTALPGAPVRNGNTLEFTYQRSKAAMADGFAFAVQYRTDLLSGSWSNSGITEQITSEDANFQQVKASRDISGAPNKGFMLLSVTP